MSKKVTAKALAKKLGVSAAAVSLALNGKPGVSDETRALIIEEASLNGVKLSPILDDNTKTQSKTICYLAIIDNYVKSGEHSMFESCVLYGVDNAANELGYNTLVKYVDVQNLLTPNIIELVTNVDGLVILATDVSHSTVRDMRKLMDITRDIPKVVIDTMILAGEVDSIGNDNFAGGAMAANTLLQKGCKTIGYLKSKKRLLNFDEREAGLIDELKKFDKELFTTVNIGLSSEEAFIDVSNWLKENDNLPDGFFADNDVLAVAALRAIKAAGYSIPCDVSIIGFDDIPLATMSEPALTTIQGAKEELGTTAVYLLYVKMNLNADKQQNSIRKTYMTPKLITRGSTNY